MSDVYKRQGMGEELLRMFIFLSGSPTEVVFTEEQWKEHTERFRTYLREVVAEDDDSPGAIVLRHVPCHQCVCHTILVHTLRFHTHHQFQPVVRNAAPCRLDVYKRQALLCK